MSVLTGRVALVTGASRGIGRAVALELARRGSLVGIVARSGDDLDSLAEQISALGARVASSVADVAVAVECEAAHASIAASLGAVDVLVNNAARIAPLTAISRVDPDEWEQTLRLNTVAPVRLSRLVLPEMLASGFGRICNVTSGVVGRVRHDPDNAYVTSKAALEAHTMHLANELRDTGVTANCVRPGLVDTAMQAFVRDQGPQYSSEAMYERYARRFAEGGLLSPEASAAVLVDSLEGEASGQIVDVMAILGAR
jgi:3-oxoacyl-[acyl-carrier protein] reductase